MGPVEGHHREAHPGCGTGPSRIRVFSQNFTKSYHLPAGGGEEAESAETAAEAESFDLEGFEEKLAAALSRVQGAGETRVVLSLDSGSRTVLAQDVERQEGGGASTVVTVGRGSGSQEVVPLQTVAPSFRGALVVCPGGGDPQVRLRLVEAVSALTGLGSDRISVCQGDP